MINLSDRILYEDQDILALNKPAGLVVHPDGRTSEPSVSEWFTNAYPESKGVGEKLADIERPGVVHRIDRETSGVLLLAKTPVGHRVLKEQFQNREIEKTYHLFVYGNIKNDRGTINLPIARSASNFKKWSAQRGSRGEKREAITHFEVLKRFNEGQTSVTFIEAKPKTGRTHQIRVHFQATHHPIVGDKLYAPKRPELLGFKRLALHAKEIKFRDISGHSHSVSAKYPEDFQKALSMLN